jgi:wyosine [tRNA(Phe)-imidazoG37] synthetase (radical SAM superfamily)
MCAERRAFYGPEEILHEVRRRVERTQEAGKPLDYVTFVADGEPTLDLNLGREIELLATLKVKVAVITNASLVWRADIREELAKADWVSLKVDSGREDTWRMVNRPVGELRWTAILDGMLAFADAYKGELATETMLVKGLNDSHADVKETADLVARLAPAKAYLAIPTRPPAEKWVATPQQEAIRQAYKVFCAEAPFVECLVGHEEDAFAATGNVEEDLLGITAVHPMREEALRGFLARAGADWSVVHGLVARGKLVELEYEGCTFYVRKF